MFRSKPNKIEPRNLGYSDIHRFDKIASPVIYPSKEIEKVFYIAYPTKDSKKQKNSTKTEINNKKKYKIKWLILGASAKIFLILCFIGCVLGLGLGISTLRKKGYTESCMQSTDCDAKIGLICQNISYICNCPNDYFYNYTTHRCETQFLYNSACIGDYQCQTAASLSCTNGTCQCPSLTGWMWSSTALRCIYCPPSWYVFGDHCYIVFNNPVSFDIAYSTCQNLNSTMIYIGNSLDYYWSQNLYLRYNTLIWMGALATAPRTFMWLKDNSTLTYCSDYWCPGEPDNSFGNLTYVGDGCLFMAYRNTLICLQDWGCNITANAACEKTSGG